jgi:hypothetical protein
VSVPSKKSRFQSWLDHRDRNNQLAMDALRAPRVPLEPALVLEASSGVADPAFAYPLQLVIDAEPVEAPWGWSVHVLPLGEHQIILSHRSGIVRKASPGEARIVLDAEHPVLHVRYVATAMGVRPGRVSVQPYEGPT